MNISEHYKICKENVELEIASKFSRLSGSEINDFLINNRHEHRCRTIFLIGGAETNSIQNFTIHSLIQN